MGLQINKVKILIKTNNGNYGFYESFKKGLNFIASENNTCGKSSILAAIYYCLGMEEIIGGRGEKVLTSVYKNYIEDEEDTFVVLESGAYLEIFNGNQIVTIYRSAKMANRDSKLITVFYSEIDKINLPETYREDMYVHMPNSAVNKMGFHTFLEKYIGLDLPLVSTSDDSERKLYLQLIFSCMFIEQKRGWADIFSGMPILGVKDSKKRVIEFILGLDTIDNERKRNRLVNTEASIKREWELLVKEVDINLKHEGCSIIGLPRMPQIIDEDIFEEVKIVIDNKENTSLSKYIENLQTEYSGLKVNKAKIIDNFDSLQNELQETDKAIKYIEEEIGNEYLKILKEDACIKNLHNNLEVIKTDLSNNKDAARLRDLGSSIGCKSSKGVCPVCNQIIQDTLLADSGLYEVMSINENIKHLVAQKDMFEFALNSHKKNKEAINGVIEELERRLFTLRRLSKSIRNDLYSIDDDLSETVIRKRVELSNRIEALKELNKMVFSKCREFIQLSNIWGNYLAEKATLPTKKLSNRDEEKILDLQNNFILNLKNYGYRSVSNLNEVSISKDTYLPITEGFDMKFDSSASDNIRAIWAFTMALLQTSIKFEGGHPNILIFDEPDQHSIVIADMQQFFNSIIKLENIQVFIGITIKDSDTKDAIERLDSSKYNIIKIKSKAFQKI